MCSYYTVSLNWDSVVNYFIPICITVIFSLALLVRVIYHRYRVHQRIEWRNYKKMAFQLLPISALYISLQCSPMVLYAGYSAGLSWSVAADYYNDSIFFSYWIILFTPFTTVLSLPELQTKCRNFFLFWRRQRVVNPQVVILTRQTTDQRVTVAPTTQATTFRHQMMYNQK